MTTPKTFEHSVQIYDTDEELLATLVKYFNAGFSAEDNCIIIATPEHRLMLEQRLADAGVDLGLMETLGKYTALDAENTLSHFMEKGMPNARKFNQVIGSMVPYIPKRPIRAYGEMVALLWEQGNRAGAIALEELWNDLGKVRNFSLHCAYHMKTLKDENSNEWEETNMIHETHSHALA